MRPPTPTVLTGRHVRLDPLAAAHAEALWVACGDDEVFAWVWPYAMPGPSAMRDVVDRAVAEAATGARVPFVQVDLRGPDPRMVGSTSYLDISTGDDRLEIGSTFLSRSVWRTPVNTEGKLLLLGHAFDALGAERVSFKTDHRNARSQTAISRLGAVREGTLRHHMRRADGTRRDTVYFSILRAEWPGIRARLRARLG